MVWIGLDEVKRAIRQVVNWTCWTEEKALGTLIYFLTLWYYNNWRYGFVITCSSMASFLYQWWGVFWYKEVNISSITCGFFISIGWYGEDTQRQSMVSKRIIKQTKMLFSVFNLPSTSSFVYSQSLKFSQTIQEFINQGMGMAWKLKCCSLTLHILFYF